MITQNTHQPVCARGATIPILALGVGNPLMGDDGLGVELIKRLAERNLPPEVRLEDGGTLGISLLPLLEDADTVLILDAVKTGAPPGSAVTLNADELPRYFSTLLSPHQIGLKEVLAAAQLCDAMPRKLMLIGLEAQNTDFCAPMSDAVQAAIPSMLEFIEEQIKRALEDYRRRTAAP